MGLVSAPFINKDLVLSKISSEQVFNQYFGPFKARSKAYSSPFRSDSNPSCIFYEGSKGFKFRDLAHPDEDLDCFAFVAELYGISYRDAVERVWNDFGLGGGAKSFSIPKIEREKEAPKETLIEVERDKWGKSYLSYWSDYGITEEELEANSVYPVRFLSVNGKEIPNWSLKMRFCYEVKWKGKVYHKIYTPHADDKKYKWLSNVPLYLLFGLSELPFKAERLILAKSQKERLIFLKYFSDVAGLQAENKAALRDKTISYLKTKYKEIVYIGDNDAPGIEAGEYFANKGLRNLGLPDFYLKDWRVKDIGDLRLKFGEEGVEHFLKSKNLL